MRAIGHSNYGGPEVLQTYDLPEVQAGPGQVRIRTQAATVNPADIMFRTGLLEAQQVGLKPPFILGMEAAGVVDEVGAGVTSVKVGDSAIAIVNTRGPQGAYREQLVVDARCVVPAPRGKTPVESATLPMNGMTARRSLDLLGLAAGQTLAVTGAAGAYGGYLIQLAKAEGLIVVADAAEKDEALVKSLGADVVVRRGLEVATRIRAHFPAGVDGLADGAVLNELAIPAVRDGGVFTSVRGFAGAPQRGIRFEKTAVFAYEHAWAKLDQLRRQVESGVLTLRVAATYPAAQAAAAHRRWEAGGTRGRLVLTF